LKKYSINIKLIFFIRICFSLIFCISVITLFWKKYNLDLFDIFLLQAIFAISIVLFEIPTGYIADKLGRKKTLFLSAGIACLGWFFYSFSTSFLQFVFVEVILGIAFSFLSGTDSSLLYETLVECGKEQLYSKYQGKQNSFRHWAEAISAFLGGILVNFVSFRALFLLSSLSVFIAFVLCFWIKEPKREPYKHPRGTFYGMYKIARFVFLKSKIVKFVAPLMAMCSLATMLGVWFYQPMWQDMQMPVWLFGFLWALISLPAGIAGHFAHEIENIIGKKKIIWLLPIPAIVGYLIIAFFPGYLILIGIYLVPILRGLNMPVLLKYIHEETFSDKRATVISIQNWIFRLSYFCIAPLIGFIGNNYNIRFAFVISAFIVLISTGFFIPLVAKRI
jgi:MFS family permease